MWHTKGKSKRNGYLIYCQLIWKSLVTKFYLSYSIKIV